MVKQTKIKRPKSKNFGNLEVILLVIITCILSLSFGFYLGVGTEEKEIADPYLSKFEENYHYIINNYYKKIDKGNLIDSAINGMVSSLGDEYSEFMDQSESSSFDATLNGSYEGVGISIALDKSNNIVIVRVIENSPSEKAGLKVMDIVKKVNAESLEGKEPSDVTSLIKNTKEKTFILTIDRDGKEMEVKVDRENITLKSIDYRMIEKDSKKIGYIYIDIFALNTTEQFKSALADLEKQGMHSLIIDVRDNGGGHLVTAKQIASQLLEKKYILYQTETKGEIEKTYSEGKNTKKYPIALLINENTASGSEVLVAALKENINAISIGTKTYGKGTVQELVGLSTGSQYKVTVKKWLTPKGNWINEKGIEPNIKVDLSEDYQKNPTYENDNQLTTALDYLKDK